MAGYATATNFPTANAFQSVKAGMRDGFVSKLDVGPPPPDEPLANAGADQTLYEGYAVTLDGSSSMDPACDPLHYRWEQIDGPAVTLSDTVAPRPGFTAPLVAGAGATLTFRLAVDDGVHTSAPDTVNVIVVNVNQEPVPKAGADQTVQEGSTVTLRGGDSFDADGDPLRYFWFQTAGAAVSLSAADTATPTFTAPSAGETLMFTVMVFDPRTWILYGDGYEPARDEVQVSVTSEANACGDGISWASPAPIVYGTGLGSAQLNATATVPGAFAYIPVAGTILDAGTRTLSATFTPTNASCETVNATVALDIGPAPLTITADNAAMILNGPLPVFTASFVGFVNGDTRASLDTPVTVATATDGSAVGSFPIIASGAADRNYSIRLVNGSLSVRYSTGACFGDLGHTILQPIDADGSSVFKQGSTVASKFRVCDASGSSIGTAGLIGSFRLVEVLNGTTSVVVDEPVSSTNPDSTFRWVGDHWIFNLATKPLAAAKTYIYRITLDDSSVIDFRFGLR